MGRDYVAERMAKFAELLATIESLKKENQWELVIKTVGKQLGQLLGVDPKELRELSESGLLARLIDNGPMATLWLPYKQIMLIRLLKETGDYADKYGKLRGGRGWHLKALHLLLNALAQDELSTYLELAPTVESLLEALAASPLPPETQALLFREYRRRKLSSEQIANLMSTLAKN